MGLLRFGSSRFGVVEIRGCRDSGLSRFGVVKIWGCQNSGSSRFGVVKTWGHRDSGSLRPGTGGTFGTAVGSTSTKVSMKTYIFGCGSVFRSTYSVRFGIVYLS